MVQQLLLAVSIIVFALGVVDFLQTRQDQVPSAVAAESCPRPGLGQRYVRINGYPAGYQVVYRFSSEVTKVAVDFPLIPYGRSASSRHVIVRALDALQVTEELERRAAARRLARAARSRARGRASSPTDDGDDPVAPPKAAQASTVGLLTPLPREFVPRDAAARFPAGAEISVLDDAAEPPLLQIPAFIALVGLLGAYFLTAGADDSRRPDAPDDPAWRPFHRIEPATGEALTYAAVAAMLAVLLAVPRYVRIGGPHLYDNQVLTLLYGIAALATGYTAVRRATNQIALTPAGIDIEHAPPPQRRIPWTDLVQIRRDKMAPSDDQSFDLTLRTARYRTVRLELHDDDGELAAAHVAAIMARTHLAPLRARLQDDARIDFDGLTLRRDKFTFESEGVSRTVDYKDLERITIHKGVLAFRLLADQWDIYTCHYQELPNGIYLPEILPGLVSAAGSRCVFSWLEAPLDGPDLWLRDLAARAEKSVAEGSAEDVAGVGDAAGPRDVAALQSLACQELESGAVEIATATLQRALMVLEAAGEAASDEAARVHHNLAIAMSSVAHARRAVALYAQLPRAHVIHAARASNALACLLAMDGQADEALDVLDHAILALEAAAAAGPLRFDAQDTDSLFTNVLTLLAGTPPAARAEVYARIVDFYRAAAPASPGLAVWLEAQTRVTAQTGDVVPWQMAVSPRPADEEPWR